MTPLRYRLYDKQATASITGVPGNAWLYFAPMAASRLWRRPVERTPQQISPELFFNTQVPVGMDFSGQYIPLEDIPVPDQSPDPLTVLPPEAQPVPALDIPNTIPSGSGQVDYDRYLDRLEQILKDNLNTQQTMEKQGRQTVEVVKERLREQERERLREASLRYENAEAGSSQAGGLPVALYLQNRGVNPVLAGIGIGGIAGAGLGYLADGTQGAIAGGLTGAGVGGFLAPQLVRQWQKQYPLA